ncbi:Deoxynucleoside kinase [Pseudolycoriella hygida]|uniref:Deoxynucleoside kinase n=1 Tax=Pseudolycoriella hygida TaxID=35572 RepID=A0A9Q0S852_9DIPT|nr:Deoxynucleoside kinase [Pseudolycoriella hygida]
MREVTNPVSNPIVSGSGGNGRCFTVAIEGNIGSGKSTFIEYCRRQTNTVTYQEPVDLWRNVGGVNLLANFYNDPRQWALAFQMAVGESMLAIYEKETFKPIKVVERSLLIYLRTSPSVAYERMRARARPEEGTVALGYLEGLHSAHEHCLRNLQEANLRNEEEIMIFTVDADLSPVALISEYEQVWHCVSLLAGC